MSYVQIRRSPVVAQKEDRAKGEVVLTFHESSEENKSRGIC